MAETSLDGGARLAGDENKNQVLLDADGLVETNYDEGEHLPSAVPHSCTARAVPGNPPCSREWIAHRLAFCHRRAQ